MAAELKFRAMGSDCHVIAVGGPPRLAEKAQGRIDELERLWSRFLADSEISALNCSAGRPVPVSRETVELVGRAVDAWRLSGGAFDPTILGDLIRAGYDRSFDLLGSTPRPGASYFGVGAGDIVIDGDTIHLPAGTGFDPGGIGKGLAADFVTHEMMTAGADGACVNMGGDVRVRGIGPNDGPWTVAVQHPWSPAPIALLGLDDGAVATSTTLRRVWVTDGRPHHHLIDPQTGQPSDTDITLSTVVAGEAWVAEVLAKAVLLRGAEHPFDILGGTGAQGLIVDRSGYTQATAALADYLGGMPVPPSLAIPASL